MNYTPRFSAAISCCVLILAVLCTVRAFPDEDWGYVQVDASNDGNIFWWSYGQQGKTPVERERSPLVLLLQGGPGASSFIFDGCEAGPVDFCLNDTPQPRKYTWAREANLLFVDQPVGTGLSYVRRDNGYAKGEDQISEQLLTMLKGFLKKHPGMQKAPFYVFAESYGGKMAASFGVLLDKAIKSGEINCTFKGVALGDSWVSPLDSVESYGNYLQVLSHLDPHEREQADQYARRIAEALQKGKYEEATSLWSEQQSYIIDHSHGVNFYNFLRHTYVDYYRLDKYVNTDLRRKFGIIPNFVQWTVSSNKVFMNLYGDFMRHSIDAVDYLLEKGYSVDVYTGQMDVIVNQPGTDQWILKLKWPELSAWLKTRKTVFRAPNSASSPNGEHDLLIDDTNLSFVKKYRNLAVWYNLYSGHMVPQDNGPIALEMFRRIVKQ